MIIYNSYAKINLFLDIISKYKNGYHGLRSIFAEISLSDQIQYKTNQKKELTFTDMSGLLPENNLLKKAGDEFCRNIKKIPGGVDFIITKNIPIGGGLGGGSSNAAAVLKILNRLWNTGFNKKKLIDIASKIGADVPFFISGGIQKAGGIGQLLSELKIKNLDLNLLLLFPETGVITAEAFKYLDNNKLCKDDYFLKKRFLNLIDGLYNNDYKTIVENVYNKFEESVFAMYPVIKKNYDELLNNNSDKVLMSGSGSTLIAFFDNQKKLDQCCDNLLKINYNVKKIKINFKKGVNS